MSDHFLFSAYGRQLLEREYVKNERSTYAIAKELGTYATLVRRALLAHGIALRTRSEAQHKALTSGRGSHPTKGRPMSQDVREKISRAITELWDQKRPERVLAAKERWASMSVDTRRRLLAAAAAGVSRAAKHGSQLEHYLAAGLIDAGYKVKTRVGPTDILLLEHRLAIRVDGPAHFLPLYGTATLARVMARDELELQALLQKKLRVVRVKYQSSKLSESQKKQLLTNLLSLLECSSLDERHVIEIEV